MINKNKKKLTVDELNEHFIATFGIQVEQSMACRAIKEAQKNGV